jgi:hypothetical protein
MMVHEKKWRRLGSMGLAELVLAEHYGLLTTVKD